jgi:hypothetical protein
VTGSLGTGGMGLPEGAATGGLYPALAGGRAGGWRLGRAAAGQGVNLAAQLAIVPGRNDQSGKPRQLEKST